MDGDEIYNCFRWKRLSFPNDSAAAHRGRIFTGPLSFYPDRPFPTVNQLQAQGMASDDPVTAELRKMPFFFRLKKSGPEDPVLLDLTNQGIPRKKTEKKAFPFFSVEEGAPGG